MKKKKLGGPLYPLKKADFGRTKAKMGCFTQKSLWYSFEILQVTKILGFQGENFLGTPPSTPKKLILGGQKPKWAVSPRRVCAKVLKFYMVS